MLRGVRSVLIVYACLLSTTAISHAEAIDKWQTPDGGLWLGNAPPAGSILLETIENSPEPAAKSETAQASVSQEDEFSRAAADGREIMRQRADERAAERVQEEDFAQNEEFRPEVIVISAPVQFIVFRHRERHRFSSSSFFSPSTFVDSARTWAAVHPKTSSTSGRLMGRVQSRSQRWR